MLLSEHLLLVLRDRAELPSMFVPRSTALPTK